MKRIARVVRRAIQFVRDAANGYEPVVARQAVAAVFTLTAGVGLKVGDLPDKADAVLVFLAVAAPLIAGARARRKVTPTKRAELGMVKLASDSARFVQGPTTTTASLQRRNRTR